MSAGTCASRNVGWIGRGMTSCTFSSTTEVAVPISAMLGAAHAINLHETGVSGVPGYVSCGNIVTSPTSMPATGFGARTIALGGAAGAVILGGLGAGVSILRRRFNAARV